MLCLDAVQARGSINCEVTISADANASFKMVNSDGTYTAPLLESTSRNFWSYIPSKHVQTLLKILYSNINKYKYISVYIFFF